MILITGATGYIGRHLVEQLARDGRRVRCLLSPYQLAHANWHVDDNMRPEIVEGTVLNEEALFHAMAGVHVIYHLESVQWWGRYHDFERIEVGGTRNLISVARSARVGRLIYLSHLGADSASAYTLLRMKGAVETLIRSSGLAYTIVRSGPTFGEGDAFINHIAMMLKLSPLVFLMPGRGETVVHPIYVDDLVKALACALDTISVVDEVIEIGGPEYTTLEDLLRTVMRVTGIYRGLLAVAPYLLRWFVSIYSRLMPRSLLTHQLLDMLATNRTARLGNTYTYFGFHPRRFEDTLLTYLPEHHWFWPGLRYAFRRRPRI